MSIISPEAYGRPDQPAGKPDVHPIFQEGHAVWHAGDRGVGLPPAPDAPTHLAEKQLVVDPLEGEKTRDFHDRRRQEALRLGDTLYRLAHGQPPPERK